MTDEARSPQRPRASVEIIVAEFNELSRQGQDFDSQLDYLQELSESRRVILIDDASSDGSWERLVEHFARGRSPNLRTVRMEKNGRKVMAVKRAIEISDADYVLLTDFDSRIVNPDDIERATERLEKDRSLAGACLKLVPEGSSTWTKFQDIEYAITRYIFGSYLSSQGNLRCIPGAAGLWRRSVLLQILREHSGRHNGDDLESTAIALRKGYGVVYDPRIEVRTSVPQSALDLYRQRKRWELGSLETYGKERSFYLSQVRNLRSRLGHVTLLDWYGWLTMVMVPLYAFNWLFHPLIAAMWATVQLGLTVTMGVVCRRELESLREFALVPFFPLYQFFAMVPRLAALYEFARPAMRRAAAVRPAPTFPQSPRAYDSGLCRPSFVFDSYAVSTYRHNIPRYVRR